MAMREGYTALICIALALGGSAETTTEVRSWPVDVAPDARAEGGSVLRMREPTLDRRTRALIPCAPPAVNGRVGRPGG